MDCKDSVAAYDRYIGLPCVYFMESNMGPVKIGLTQNLKERFWQLQSGQPYQFDKVIAVACLHHEMRRIESFAHDLEKDNHRAYEWFDTTLKDLIPTIQSCVRKSAIGTSYFELWPAPGRDPENLYTLRSIEVKDPHQKFSIRVNPKIPPME